VQLLFIVLIINTLLFESFMDNMVFKFYSYKLIDIDNDPLLKDKKNISQNISKS